MPRQEAKFKINMDKYYIFKQFIYKKRHKGQDSHLQRNLLSEHLEPVI